MATSTRSAPARTTSAEARESVAKGDQDGGGGGGGGPDGGDGGGGDVRLHVHESYAVVTGARQPNDVQDLLWAVAYIRMALACVADALADRDTQPFTD